MKRLLFAPLILLLFVNTCQAQYAPSELFYQRYVQAGSMLGPEVGPLPVFVPGGSHNFQFPSRNAIRYAETQRGLDPWLPTVEKVRTRDFVDSREFRTRKEQDRLHKQYGHDLKTTLAHRVALKGLQAKYRAYNDRPLTAAEADLNAVQTQLYLNFLASQEFFWPTWYPYWYPRPASPFFGYGYWPFYYGRWFY